MTEFEKNVKAFNDTNVLYQRALKIGDHFTRDVLIGLLKDIAKKIAD